MANRANVCWWPCLSDRLLRLERLDERSSGFGLSHPGKGVSAVTKQMQGSVPPLITPFRSGEIDLETFERLTIRQIECGSDGVAVTGTSGEPAALTLRERSALFRSAKAVVPEDKLLIAGTGAESLTATIETDTRRGGAGC